MAARFTRANSCQYHCSSCDLCFASLLAFDSHLGGERRNWRHRKMDKAKKGGVLIFRLRTSKGQCKNSGTSTRFRREIWEHAEQADAAREAFAGMNAKKKKTSRK